MSVGVIIAAAGSSTRMGSGESKIFFMLKNEPVIIHSIKAFEKTKKVSKILIIARDLDISLLNKLIKKYSLKKVVDIIPGGSSRHQSVRNGLVHFAPDETITEILVHDAARPLVEPHHIDKLIEQGRQYNSALLATPVKDTIKRTIDDILGYTTIETLQRSTLWTAQTPQYIKKDLFIKAYQKADEENYEGTDDVSLVEKLALPVKLVEGSYENIKLTTLEDRIVADMILSKRKVR